MDSIAQLLAKASCSLLFRDSARPLIARLFVAEAEKEQFPARFQDGGQTGDVLFPVIIGKNVKEAAVDHVVESLGPLTQGCGVLDEEVHGKAALAGLAFCSPNRFFEKIDAGDLVAAAGEEQSRVARATTRVQDRARDLVSYVYEWFLRLTDVPRGLAGIEIFESRTIGYRHPSSLSPHGIESWSTRPARP